MTLDVAVQANTRTDVQRVIGPFHLREDIAPAMYLAIDPAKEEIDGVDSYQIRSFDMGLETALYNMLSVPNTLHYSRRPLLSQEEADEYSKRVRKFNAGILYVSHAFAWATLAMLPRRKQTDETPIGGRVHRLGPDEDSLVMIANILRAAEKLVIAAEAIFADNLRLPPEIVHVWCDRASGVLDIKNVDIDLLGRHLVVLELLGARGDSSVDAVDKIIEQARGVSPKQVIFCFAHAHLDTVMRVRKWSPTSPIFVGMLHKGKNAAHYLEGPGQGDGGSLASQVRDEKKKD